MRRKSRQLGVGVNVVMLVPVVLRPRSAVFDDESRSIGDSALRHNLYHVLKERNNRIRVLASGVAVDSFSQVLLEIEAALERRSNVLLARSHQDPLPRHSLSDHVLLERVRLVE